MGIQVGMVFVAYVYHSTELLKMLVHQIVEGCSFRPDVVVHNRACTGRRRRSQEVQNRRAQRYDC